MKLPVIVVAVCLVAPAAQAANIEITCTISSVETFIDGNMFTDSPDGPFNFTITPEGLVTTWGGNCALMKGQVTPDRVDVACDGFVGASNETPFKEKVAIDRQMGTYNASFMTGADASSKRFSNGTCQKREAF